MELDVILQSEALSVVTSGEDGSVVVLLVVTGVRSDIIANRIRIHWIQHIPIVQVSNLMRLTLKEL